MEAGRLRGARELDAAYFAGRRKGKRGRGAAGKSRVFGLLARQGRVYTKGGAPLSADELMQHIRAKTRKGSDVEALRTGNLKQLGIGAITSAAEGVKEGAKSLYQEGTSAASRLVDGIMDRLDIHSPSQVMIALGVEAGHSFLFGVQAGIRGGDFSAEVEKLIADNARRTGLPPELIRAVIRQESGGHKGAHSPVGAQG